MNDFDRDNFVWYTNASLKEQSEWLEEASMEDLRYMTKLIRLGINELIEEQTQLIESDIVAQGCEEAHKVLEKFRLNK